MRYGTVYLITNTITGKKYIGQTTQDVQKRFHQHATDSRSGRHLYNTIKCYGEENFIVDELITCFDQKSLDFMETYFIELHNTFTPNGYNLCMGGNGKGIIGDATRQKMSMAKKGKPSKKKDHSWSEEAKLKASRRQNGKPIVATCLKTGKKIQYDFINQAKKDGFNNSEIYRVLCGKRKHHKNYTFAYVNQSGSPENNILEHAQRIGIETAKAE